MSELTINASLFELPEPKWSPLREDLELVSDLDSPGGKLSWKLYDPVRNQFFKLGWLQFECLKRWALGNVEDIVAAVKTDTPLDVSRNDVLDLQEFLGGNELVRVADSDTIRQLAERKNKKQKSWWSSLFSLTVYHRIPLFRPDALLAVLHKALRPVLSAQGGVMLLLAACIALLGVNAHWYEFKDQFAQYLSPGGLLAYAFVILAINIIHELGHGIAAHHVACKVPRMGVAMVFMLPLFYSDTTDTWRVGRRQRMAVGAAGMLAELVLAIVATILWLVLPDGGAKTLAYFVAATSWILTLLINLNPFMKFDGYFLLADYLGVDNLQSRAFANMRWQLRRTLLGAQQNIPFPCSRRTHRALVVYALATCVYRLFLYFAIALLIYSFWFKALGLVLMFAVVGMFLLRPLLSELAQYRELVREGDTSRRRWFSLAALCLLLLLLLAPLPRNVVAPAVLGSTDSARIFSPQSAKISEVLVAEGGSVAAGDTIAILSDPELDFRRAILKQEISSLIARLQQEQAWQHSDGFQQLSAEALDSKRAELAEVEQKLDALHLRSPVRGQVRQLAPWLSSGTWLESNQVIAEISNVDSARVNAYVSAQDLERIKPEPAWFFSQLGERVMQFQSPSFSATAISMLEDTMLSVPNGGTIPVRMRGSGAMAPLEDWHQGTMAPVEQGQSIAREQAGYVVLQAEASSLAWRALQRVYAVILRESGF